MATELIFCFDLICPFAYIASRLVEAFAMSEDGRRVTITFRPVLLGALYRLDNAAQGAAGSAMAIMPLSKQIIIASDLYRQAHRYGVTLNVPSGNILSLAAMRALASIPSQADIRRAAHHLFAAHWIHNDRIDDDTNLARLLAQINLVVADSSYQHHLRDNTRSAFENGVFGVPTFIVHRLDHPPVMLFGLDRFDLVLAELLGRKRQRHRITIDRPLISKRRVRFWFDIASPWSFLAFMQADELRARCQLDLIPILVGGLFRAVGTPMVATLLMSARKQAYGKEDLQRCGNACGVECIMPNWFPLRSVLACRVALIDMSTCETMFRAVWQEGRDIGKADVLRDVLDHAGFPGTDLVDRALHDADVKARLVANTSEAAKRGLIGVPTFEFEEHLLWGQDRIDQLLDMLCGWRPELNLSQRQVLARMREQQSSQSSKL